MRQKIYFLFLIIILIYSKTGFSQSNLQISQLNNNCDTLIIQTNAFFNLGTLGTCPPLAGYTYNTNSDTVNLTLYYNTAGVWPAHFCNQIDTLLLIIPPVFTTLTTQAFSIASSDTLLSTAAAISIPLCITGITDITRQNENVLIKPNPVEDILNIELQGRIEIEMISIYNVQSNLILKQSKSNKLDVSELNPGIYLLYIKTENEIYRKKFLKK